MGRLGGMTQVNGTTETGFASASYGIAGELTSLQYAIGEFGSGSYMGEGRSYNSMFQLTGITVKNYQFPQSGPQEVKLLEDTYTYTAGANNGRITSATDGVISETVNYTYDALNRLASASASSWGQGFAYDGFGNLTTKSALSGSVPVLSVSFDPATNRQVGVSYDANGNPDGSTYDVENRMIAGNSMTYTYDHAGKRVMKQNGSTFDLYFYGIGGQKLETKTCTTGGGGTTCQSGSFNTYFGGKLVRAAGKSVAVDRLGSVRGTYYGSTTELMRYYPYGEERTSTSDGREKFGTYTRDSSTQDYADQRYYNVGAGRFNIPDPAGYLAADPTGPSTWNRYASTQGDPVNRYDRNGLQDCLRSDNGCPPLADGGGDLFDNYWCRVVPGFGFVPWPSPLCPVDLGSEYYEPPAPKYGCTTTAFAGQSLGNVQANIRNLTPGGGNKLGVTVAITFNATGGPSGPLDWRDAQYRTGYGWANYSDGYRIEFTAANDYERLDGNSLVRGSWTVKDQPGFPWRNGTMVDAYWTETYVLHAWYFLQDGTKVTCPTVTWNLTFSFDHGKLKGGAFVTSVD